MTKQVMQPQIRRIPNYYRPSTTEDASTILHGTHGFDDTVERLCILCDSNKVAQDYERHLSIIRANITNGKRLMYGVLKK